MTWHISLSSQPWITIRQWAVMHPDVSGLLPDMTQRTLAKHLCDVCRAEAMPMYEAHTADEKWHDERTYCAAILDAVIPDWLESQQSQWDWMRLSRIRWYGNSRSAMW